MGNARHLPTFVTVLLWQQALLTMDMLCWYCVCRTVRSLKLVSPVPCADEGAGANHHIIGHSTASVVAQSQPAGTIGTKMHCPTVITLFCRHLTEAYIFTSAELLGTVPVFLLSQYAPSIP